MSEFFEFGFGEGDESVNKRDRRFKAKAGEKYVVSFAWFKRSQDNGNPDLSSSPNFIGCQRLYNEKVGYFLDHGPEYRKYAQSDPKTSAATVVISWPIDDDSAIDAVKLSKFKWKVFPWIVSTDKYSQIKSVASKFPLGSNDLEITCTDTKFQKMTFIPVPDGMLAKAMKSKKIWPKLSKQIAVAISSVNDELAQDLTLQQIRDRIGEEGPSPVETGAIGEIDDVLDDMLDD